MEYHGPERITGRVRPGMILLSSDFSYAKRARRNAGWSLEIDPSHRHSDAFSERRGRQLFLVESVSFVDIKGQPIDATRIFGDKAIAVARLIRKDTGKPSKLSIRIPMAMYNTEAIMDAKLVGEKNLETGEIRLWTSCARYGAPVQQKKQSRPQS